MRAILFGLVVCVMIWFALVVVHSYGQYKYMCGVHDATHLTKYSCTCDTIKERRSKQQ